MYTKNYAHHNLIKPHLATFGPPQTAAFSPPNTFSDQFLLLTPTPNKIFLTQIPSPVYYSDGGYEREYDETRNPLVVLIGEEREAHVGKDEVLREKVDEFKQVFGSASGFLR